MFFGKTNSSGLLRQNWAKFSSGTILPLNAPYSQLGPEKRYWAGFIKKFQPKTCYLGCTKLRSGALFPQSRHVVRLAIKIGEVRFSIRIPTVNVFFGKTNSRGLLRKNSAKFSSGTILPPNAPHSQWGLEKMYEAGFIKKFQKKTCFLGRTKLHSKALLPPIVPSSPFGKGNRWGVIYYKNSNRKRVFWKNEFERAFEAKLGNVFVRILPPNAPYSQLRPEKRYGAGFVKKSRLKTCFLGRTKLRSGTLFPPIAPSSPFGP